MNDHSDYVIETRALSKRYGRKLALDHLDLRIPRGRIHDLPADRARVAGGDLDHQGLGSGHRRRPICTS